MKTNNDIEFNVNKAPPSDAYIKSTIAKLNHPSTWIKRLALIIAYSASVSIFLVYLCPAVFIIGVGGSIEDVTPIEWVTGPLALNLSILLFSMLVISLLPYAGLHIPADIQLLSAVDSEACAHIINLCKQYPQIEAYRLAVTKERQIVNADYEAMKIFLEDQSRLKLAKQQQVNIDAVQSQSPITNQSTEETK